MLSLLLPLERALPEGPAGFWILDMRRGKSEAELPRERVCDRQAKWALLLSPATMEQSQPMARTQYR